MRLPAKCESCISNERGLDFDSAPFFLKILEKRKSFFRKFFQKKKKSWLCACHSRSAVRGRHLPPQPIFFSKSQKIDLRFSRMLRKKDAESKSNPPSFDMHGPHFAGSLPRWQLLHVKSAACILGGFQQDVWYVYRTKEGCISILHPFLVNFSKSANHFFLNFRKKNFKNGWVPAIFPS